MKYKNVLIRIGQYLTIALIIISLILLFTFPNDESRYWYWAMLFAGVAGEAVILAFTKQNRKKDASKKEHDSMSKFFFTGIAGIIVIMLVIGIWGAYALQETAFRAIAMVMIILWACVFLGYFLWAVYFYNVNFGITQEEWDRIDESKRKKRMGEYYSEADLAEEPKYNPYDDQTFGLPPGTVRGMIAFTLLFGGISTLIMSIGMDDCLECQSAFRDQFEFFKTAFIMMIAFYFGSRSLEYLTPKNNTGDSRRDQGGVTPSPVITGIPVIDSGEGAGPVINPMAPDANTGTTETPTQPKPKPGPPDEDQIVFINPMDKK
jgi:hypothetical protein